jgi:uncharacterized Zn finger protein (UPF0148 family)
MTITLDVDKTLGHLTEKVCADCGDFLYESKDGTMWCGDCGFSNDEYLSNFIRSLSKMQPNLELAIREPTIV